MNSRDRILAAMRFEETDRVPVDLGGHRCTGIMAMAYARLRDYLGLPKAPIRISDMLLQLAVVDDDMQDFFGADVIEFGRGFCLGCNDWKPWRLPDGTECWIPYWIHPEQDATGTWLIRHADGTPIAVQRPGMLYFEQVVFPMHDVPDGEPDPLDCLPELMSYEAWSAVPGIPGPLSFEGDGLAALVDGARRLRASTDKAIAAHLRGPLFEGGQHQYGMDRFYVLLASEPDRVHAFLDVLTDLYIARAEKFLSAVGKFVDVVIFSDDFGMQTGLQISPRMYRTFFKPRQKRLWGRIKELAPDVKVLLHSCGAMAELLPDLAEVGVDAWNPVQISARNMEPERLKREYGRAVTFWGGGCDTQSMLRTGTPDEIRAHVTRNLSVFAPGGGFIFAQVHNIMADVPPQNVVAMFDAVRRFNA